MDVEIPYPVLEYLAYNIKDNIRELEGVIKSLIFSASIHNRKIDKELAKEVVKDHVTTVHKEITLDFIQQIVSDQLNVTMDNMHGKTRKRSAVLARQLSMYLAKNYTNKSLKTIGETLGGRDHSTVIYSCKAVQDLMDTDPVFKKTVEELDKKIAINTTETA